MSWEIKARTSEIVEGDNGKKQVTFDIEWTGVPEKGHKFVSFDLKIEDGTATDDNVVFAGGVGGKERTIGLALPKVGDGVTTQKLTKAVTVEFDSDTRVENDESFAVKIVNAGWFKVKDGFIYPQPKKTVGKSDSVKILDDDKPSDPDNYVINHNPRIIELEDEETDVFDFFVGYGHDRPAGSFGGHDFAELEAPDQPSGDGSDAGGPSLGASALDLGLMPLVPFETVTHSVDSLFDWG